MQSVAPGRGAAQAGRRAVGGWICVLGVSVFLVVVLVLSVDHIMPGEMSSVQMKQRASENAVKLGAHLRAGAGTCAGTAAGVRVRVAAHEARPDRITTRSVTLPP